MHKLKLTSLSSGSHGNCSYIGNGETGFIIDCGVSYKKFAALMKKNGLENAPIDGVIVTHEHTDHIGGIVTLERELEKAGFIFPIWMTHGTYNASKVRPKSYEPLKKSGFYYGGLDVTVFSIPHDAADPIAVRVSDDTDSIGVITDLGKPTLEVGEQIAKCTSLLLEANHDENLLMRHEGYNYILRQRIRGAYGHLSNRQAGKLLQFASNELRTVYLGHLSPQTNSAKLALDTVEEIVGITPYRIKVLWDEDAKKGVAESFGE